MTSASVARRGRVGIHRPDPRAVRWTAADLARRRSLVVAQDELEASEQRGDSARVVAAWRAVVDAMARAEDARR